MKSNAFSLVDLIAALVIIALVGGLIFPAVQASRETARRQACMNNLRQIGVAMQQYHDTFQTLPGHKVGPGAGNRKSVFANLLPQLGQQALYNELAEQRWQVPWSREKAGKDGQTIRDKAGKTTPGPYCTTIPLFLCPEDTAFLSKKDDEIAYTNYVASHGDWITGQNETFTRGPFVPNNWLKLEDIVDGAANTIAMSERAIASNKSKTIEQDKEIVQEYDGTAKTQGNIIVAKEDVDPNDPEKPAFASCFQRAVGDTVIDPDKLEIDRNRAGTRWGDGQHFFTVTNTILPPNAASCMLTTVDLHPLISPPTSYHVGGVNVLMLDGQTKFVSNVIDCGGTFSNKKCVKEGPSPFGVWGAMGSIADFKPASPVIE